MASRQTKPDYKPLLFSTTVRNPSRMKDALKIMSKFEDFILLKSLTIIPSKFLNSILEETIIYL